MASWLRPSGYLLLATVPADVEQVDIAFMGHPTRASSYAAPDYLDRLRRSGLEVLESRESAFISDHEAAEPENILFVYCRRVERSACGEVGSGEAESGRQA
ncbi:hypothetical protein OG203_34275 [Nocardia sp. NBC_01499]|uniref:hypothetical protein n=1 Tax=Nocardia sp. NBC_01499 TaxID=2903597 RepID=UPI00386AE89C